MLLLGRVFAALISGALLAQAYGLTPFWLLAWVAPIPLLIAVMGATRIGAFAYGAIAGALSMGGLFTYFMGLGGLVPTLVVCAIKALIWGAMMFAVRSAARRLPTPAAAFVFPALMAGIETLIAAMSPHGSAGSLAYSQMDFLPAIQVAALGGAPAIAFVLAAFASAFAFLVARRAIVSAATPIALAAAALVFGWMRPGLEAPHGAPVRVALLAGDQFDGVPMDWRLVWSAYTTQVEHAADDDFRIVLAPEKIAHLPPDERGAALAQLEEIARRRDVLLVVGVDDETEEGQFNRAYVFSNAGAQTYDKRHMIPGFESHFTLGAADLIVERNGQRFGVAICKDMDFPALGRRYAGVHAMLVPAWDFGEDAWLHSRMAMLRGVENGYAVIRSARDGALTVSDAYGHVLAEARSGPQTAFTTQEDLFSPGPTIYARIGDAFGWAMLALAALLVGWTIWARRRAGSGD